MKEACSIDRGGQDCGPLGVWRTRGYLLMSAISRAQMDRLRHRVR